VKSQLLPEGFRDSLPELADKQYKINSLFIDFMQNNGYLLVNPPLLEFESSLFFLNKSEENVDSFRVLDPLSQKMMGLRSDITLQIGRISCGSLSKTLRPLRLCYSGEVMKVKNTSLDMSRQLTQIGAEIIGIKNSFCEYELIELIIEILKKLKIKKFIISFTMPTLLDAIAQDFKLSKSNYEFIKDRFKNKNFTGLNNISNGLENISSLLFSSVGDPNQNISKIKNFDFPPITQKEVNNFLSSIIKLKEKFSKYRVLIDPLEIDDSEYHSGIAFKVYSENLKEIFSGGKYNVFNENCIGFSGFLENLINESELKFDQRKKIFVSIETSLKQKKSFQKKRFVVVPAGKKLKLNEIKSEAKKYKCDFFFIKNKIQKV